MHFDRRRFEYDFARKAGGNEAQLSKSGMRIMKPRQQSIAEWLLAPFLVSALISCAPGQATRQPMSQTESGPESVNDVSLDLVVHDKKNRQVLDLRAGEVAVTDDNSPVALGSLRLITGKQEYEPLITLVFDPANSNTGLRREKNSSRDEVMAKKTRDLAAKILRMVPDSGFVFSVLDVEGRLRLRSEFTSDRNALVTAVQAATEPVKSDSGRTATLPELQDIAEARSGADLSGKAASARDRVLAQALFSALDNSGRIAQDRHIGLSLAGILALAQSQQQIAQRKTLIYFTSFEGGHVDSRTEDTIESIIGAADRAGMSIYIVDLSEFNDSQQVDAGLVGNHLSVENRAMMDQQPENATGQHDNSILQRLAEGTGGGYISGNSPEKALEQMVQDMTVYYVASFLPPFKEYDGKFHSVTVKPLRAGLKVRAQTGYLSLPEQAGGGGSPQPFELPLLKILKDADLPADVEFHTAILRMGDLPEGNVNTLAIEIPLSNLEILDDSSTNVGSAHVSVVAEVKDEAGTVVEHFSEDISRRGTMKEIEKD
jgi:VWFA-related protein